ncbi:MAG: TetR/AcrR family transcriptional regulator [Saprospiraceae bacterium]|jgi:AcrR family transcriptional regulator|nr:TetR/AcrR family transcriptional regulator [Saprospiraceae bacterium]
MGVTDVKSLNRKEEILRAAASLFTEKGYSATSMRHLAGSVGLEVSSIYSHIKSKEDLLTEICMTCAHRFLSGMREILQAEEKPVVQLQLILRLHIDMAYDYPESVTVFNKEWRHLPENVLHLFVDQRKQYEFSFKQILEQGRESGVFLFKDTDMIFRILLQTVKFSYFSVRKFPKEQLIKEVLQFVMYGIQRQEEILK